MHGKVLIPVNASATSERTLDALIAHQRRFPNPLVLLHVVDIDKLAYRMIPDFQVEMVRERAREAGEQLLEKCRRRFEEAGMTCEARLEFGSPRQLICRIANEEDFDLVVIGRRTSGEIRDVLFGSVSNHVLHQVHCPVLLF